jgi:DNA-binding transcriptional LysR family regulator
MDGPELRQLRCFVAITEAGSFTDAAAELGVSQAAVSRSLAALERALGVRLLRRTTREVSPTAIGLRVLAHARRVLAEADALVEEATTGHTRLRLGYAWSALGRHTLAFQRRWAALRPDTELHLVRTNSATGGLAEGACDLAVVRRPPEDRRFATALVGVERRYCALAADDPWARRRSVRLAEIARRTVLVDPRTGTTTLDLWPPETRPASVRHTYEIDDWLSLIATGRAVGVTPESTAAQYRRPGLTYRPVRDAEPVPVLLTWWRDAPHPATRDAITLATELYRD